MRVRTTLLGEADAKRTRATRCFKLLVDAGALGLGLALILCTAAVASGNNVSRRTGNEPRELFGASQSSSHDWLAEANALRSSNGLPLLVAKTSGPLAEATARAASEDGTDPSMFDPFRSGDPADFCETCSDVALGYYTDAGGMRPVAFAELGQQNPLIDGLRLSPTAAALLLDPRTEAVSFANAENPTVTLFGVELAEDRAITAPVLVGEKLVDPVHPFVALLIPAGQVLRATLLDSRGTVASFGANDFVTGAGGLRALGLTTGEIGRRAFSYGHGYTVKTSGATFHFKTMPVSKSFLARTWRFKGVNASDRARFLSAIRAAPPLFRRSRGAIDGGISVVRGTCAGTAGCAGQSLGDGKRGFVSIGSFSNRFLIYHELGHQIDFLAVDDPAWNRLFAAFRRSPAWRKCIPDNSFGAKGCLEKIEVFADQVAYWALGLSPKNHSSTFDDHPLLKPRAFGQLLGRLWGVVSSPTGDPAAVSKGVTSR